MGRLFIVGNGFDCYSHFDNHQVGMKTRYVDFKNYLLKRYPKMIDPIPYPYRIEPGYEYNENTMVSYIVQTLNECQDNAWSTLENAMGESLVTIFMDDIQENSYLLSFKNGVHSQEEFMAYYAQLQFLVERGLALEDTAKIIKKLFYDWVTDCLQKIDYSEYNKHVGFEKVFDINHSPDDKYLTFNYTLTLEKLYHIPENQVFHIHGKVGQACEKIHFGHGNDVDDMREMDIISGLESSVSRVLRTLEKNTDGIIYENKQFFQELQDITEIYSYGFSFGDVDMVYVDEICKYVNPQEVIWYFNTYDTVNNPEYLQKIRERGFTVKTESRWNLTNK